MQPHGTESKVTRQIWLLYFNRTLFEQEVISEKEYNQMILKIQSDAGNAKGEGKYKRKKR